MMHEVSFPTPHHSLSLLLQLDLLFMEDFGRTPNELFSTFSEHPVAAASLAQVSHCRTLFFHWLLIVSEKDYLLTIGTPSHH